MKTLTCDNCKSTERDVKTYTYGKSFMSIKVDYPFTIVGDGIAYRHPPEKEFCDNCAGIIQTAYKKFLEEYIP